MLLFIASETALFLVLLAAYFYVRIHSDGHWPQGDIEKPKLLRPALMTVFLIAGSAPVYLAEQAAKRGLQTRLRLALAATFVLGAAFVGLQVWDFSASLDRFGPQKNAYASLLYTIVGLHGTHVALGLVLVCWTFLWALLGRFTPERNLAIQNVALYWHFLSASWVVLFLTLYLSVSL